MLLPKVHFATTEDLNMYYLVRARIADAFFYIDTGKSAHVILNALEIDAFKEHNKNPELNIESIEPFIAEARTLKGDESLGKAFAYAVFKRFGLLNTPAEVARNFPLDLADYLRSKGVQLVVKEPFLPERIKKSAQEINYIRNNLEKTCAGYELIEKVLRDSTIVGKTLVYEGNILTSEYLKDRVEKLMFEKGMEDVEGMIIASGPQAAMPHHKGSGPILPNETIVCDLFFRDRTNRYYADMTRTYCRGTPSEKAIEMYDAVLMARNNALSAIQPGVAYSEIHSAAAKTIADAGFDVGSKGFIHSTGHGLGLALHELPNVGPNSKEFLEPGHVITIEPGLYYPEWGGVRLEDVVVITDAGYESLTNYPTKFVL